MKLGKFENINFGRIRDTFAGMALGAVIGATGWQVYLSYQEDLNAKANRKELAEQIVDDIVLGEYPFIADYKDDLLRTTHAYIERNDKLITCYNKNGGCDMPVENLIDLTIELGNQIRFILQDHPELIPEGQEPIAPELPRVDPGPTVGI